MRTYKLTTPKNADGQPIRMFRAARANNESKAIDLLAGICTGILADGIVNEKEAEFFVEWIREHAALEPIWPFTEVLNRVEKIFADGQCTEHERKELKEIMEALCGKAPDISSHENYSTALPFNSPPPNQIAFQKRRFNITGRFAFGTRQDVIGAINSRGGFAVDTMPTQETHYLIIGVFASRDWVHNNYGRKIEKAIEIRNSGHDIAIISEEYWKKFVNSTAS